MQDGGHSWGDCGTESVSLGLCKRPCPETVAEVRSGLSCGLKAVRLLGEQYLGGRGRALSDETADVDAGRAEAAGGVAAIPKESR